MAMLRLVFPGPSKADPYPVTNVRDAASGFWARWLEPRFRCLVPAASFCEYEATKPRKTPTWFALDETRPLFAFAGIWRPWNGGRGTKADDPDRVEAGHRLFAVLTTDANAVVAPTHPKAMPAILTTPEEWDVWLLAP